MTNNELELADSSLHKIASPISRCYLAKLYYFGYRRGLAGDDALGDAVGTALLFTGELSSIRLTLEEVEAYIETEKQQGRYWQVYDTPAIVIEAAEKDSPKLVVTGGGFHISPLDGFTPKLPDKREFGNLARALMSHGLKNVYALQTHRSLSVATFPFVSRRSVPSEYKRIRRESGDEPIKSKWIEVSKWGWPQSAIKLVSEICLWLADDPK